jgi:hypothetical protein
MHLTFQLIAVEHIDVHLHNITHDTPKQHRSLIGATMISQALYFLDFEATCPPTVLTPVYM